MAIEYRVCWSASSNISFHGATDWQTWEQFYEEDEPAPTLKTVEESFDGPLDGGHVALPFGLEQALEASGFDWHVETREAQEVSSDG